MEFTRKHYRLLSVGNSFSDDMQAYLYPILKAFGVKDVVIANLYIGGCSIATHLDNAYNDKKVYAYKKNNDGKFIDTYGANMALAFNDEEWDFVSFQEGSAYSGLIDEIKDRIDDLRNFVVSRINSNVKTVWHMTWSYQNGIINGDFEKYNNNSLYMYNMIVSSAKKAILNNKNFDYISCSGTAIENARTSYVGDTLNRDGVHLEELGRFICGLLFVLNTTNYDINDIDMDLIPQKFVRYFDIIKESVINAIKNPFSITDSKYKTDSYLSIKRNSVDEFKHISYSNVDDICRLDIYQPHTDAKDFPIVIHFHGGGLVEGSKDDECNVKLAYNVARNNICFISCNYRLYPSAKYPDFLVDASNAIKYVFNYMNENSLTGKVYISGQSAGSYIAMMLLFNKRFLSDVGLDSNNIAGWIIESGQPTSHFNILKEEGFDSRLERIDDKSPLYYVNEDSYFNDLLLIAYTNDIPCRESENRLLYNKLKEFNPNANVALKIYEGTHCEYSTTPYRDHYAHVDKIVDYINRRK